MGDARLLVEATAIFKSLSLPKNRFSQLEHNSIQIHQLTRLQLQQRTRLAEEHRGLEVEAALAAVTIDSTTHLPLSAQGVPKSIVRIKPESMIGLA